MSIVKAQISISLDGFIAGPNESPSNPLGDGGERLHEWVYGLESWRKPHGLSGGQTNRDSEILEEATANTGAVLMGRRMFNSGEEPWGPNPPFHVPVFVVTHKARPPLVREGGTTFYFVTDGLESALAQARAAAGDQDVSVAGGGQIITQLIQAGLLDEIDIHIAPILLGNGVRLFNPMDTGQIDVTCVRVVDSEAVTHLKYRFNK